MKKFYLLLIALAVSGTVFAQNVPILPKKWAGFSSTTSMGSIALVNPRHPKSIGKAELAQDWNTYDEPRTLTITRQEGRHLELLLTYPKGEYKYIGTLSKDGKQLMLASREASFLLNVSEDTLSGCGGGRGGNGAFEHWLNNYAATCFDFTAVK